MNVLKTHMVPLICAAIVVLALLACFVWPLPGYSSDLIAQETARLKTADRFTQAGKMPIFIPDVPPIAFNGPITLEVIKAKGHVQSVMHENATEINKLASQDNEAGRILRRDKAVIPLLDGVAEPNYLPVVSNDPSKNPNADPSLNADPTEFTDVYNSTFNHWISLLVTGSKTLPTNFDAAHTGVPPDMTLDVMPAWQAAERTRIAGLPTFPGAPVPVPNPSPSMDFLRNVVNQRASKIRMYVNRESFQIRPSTVVNTEIFQALADCWLQGDAVRTIDAINSEALAKWDDQNVGHSPIKRLIRMAVGSSAGVENTSGNLFSDIGKGMDYSKTMTGRVGSEAYDVTTLYIVMDIDPSYINKFIAGLYKQNNGYTVVGMKITAVDPFVAASNGYIYGNTQVVTVELRFEALLFHGWTEGIMPAGFRNGGGGNQMPGVFGGPHP